MTQKSTIIAAFFRMLEARFGNISALKEPKAAQRVLCSEGTLFGSHLRSLFRHECCAVHVKGFYPSPASGMLAQQLAHRNSRDQHTMDWKVATGRGLESADVNAVGGTPYVMAMDSAREQPSRLDDYFRDVPKEIEWLRLALKSESKGISFTNLSPLDKLRLELDECWPGGATLLKDVRGRPFLPGVGRLMQGPTRWADGFAHVDELAPLTVTRGLFSANIYLEMPPTGGELHIWNVAWRNRWDFYRHATTLSLFTTPNEDAQRQLRRILPAPMRLRPEPGDLVLICVQRPHAVQGFPVGRRVSLQSFLTHKGAQNPIVIDN
jgi:hypothetical protein